MWTSMCYIFMQVQTHSLPAQRASHGVETTIRDLAYFSFLLKTDATADNGVKVMGQLPHGKLASNWNLIFEGASFGGYQGLLLATFRDASDDGRVTHHTDKYFASEYFDGFLIESPWVNPPRDLDQLTVVARTRQRISQARVSGDDWMFATRPNRLWGKILPTHPDQIRNVDKPIHIYASLWDDNVLPEQALNFILTAREFGKGHLVSGFFYLHMQESYMKLRHRYVHSPPTDDNYEGDHNYVTQYEATQMYTIYSFSQIHFVTSLRNPSITTHFRPDVTEPTVLKLIYRATHPNFYVRYPHLELAYHLLMRRRDDVQLLCQKALMWFWALDNFVNNPPDRILRYFGGNRYLEDVPAGPKKNAFDCLRRSFEVETCQAPFADRKDFCGDQFKKCENIARASLDQMKSVLIKNVGLKMVEFSRQFASEKFRVADHWYIGRHIDRYM